MLVDRLTIKDEIDDRLLNSLEIASKISQGQIIINYNKTDHFFSQNFACLHCDLSYESLEPSSFSFNSPYGACKKCDGLGTKTELDIDKIVPNKSKSIIDGALAPIGSNVLTGKGIGRTIKQLFLENNISYTCLLYTSDAADE